MLSGRAEYQDKAKPKPWKGFTIHRKARNSNGLPALVAALIAYIEVLAGQAILSNWFWTGPTGLGPMGGARLSIHRVGLSNFSAKNTPVTPWIPFRPPGFPQCLPGNLSLPWASQLQRHCQALPRPFRDTSVLLPSLFRCLQPDFPHCFRLSVCESRGIFYLG